MRGHNSSKTAKYPTLYPTANYSQAYKYNKTIGNPVSYPIANNSRGYNTTQRQNATFNNYRPSVPSVTVINNWPNAINNFNGRPSAPNASANANRPPVQNILNIVNNLTPGKKPAKSSANNISFKQSFANLFFQAIAVIMSTACTLYHRWIVIHFGMWNRQGLWCIVILKFKKYLVFRWKCNYYQINKMKKEKISWFFMNFRWNFNFVI